MLGHPLRVFANRLATAVDPRRRRLEALRARWGRAGTKDAWLASRYFELTRTESSLRQVDDRTWIDLEFPRIFATLDTTVTRLGSQCLFRLLRTYPDDPSAATALRETAQALRADGGLREEIQLRLGPLEVDSSANVVEALFGRHPEPLKYHRLISLWSIACIALLVGVLASPLSPLLILPVLAVNAAVVLGIAPQMLERVETLKRLQTLVRVAHALAGIDAQGQIPQLAAISSAREERWRARRALRWFAVLQRMHEPLGLDIWLNFLCLGELTAYHWTLDRLAEVRQDLQRLYEQIGTLDAATAIACFLERMPEHCAPVVTEEPLIDIEAGRHPLLARQTANSVRLRGRSALISGSNMAGKTTFIKMVATNMILGRTLGVCLAARAVIPRSSVMACIRGEHSVESGKSRYFAEMEALLSFLRIAEDGGAPVFVIDEPFSGTNTEERIAAAKAVLTALTHRAQVLATTHDVELQTLLEERFDMFHFREDPDVEGFFDYHVRFGACAEGNALRLLKKNGFPQEVVEEALALVAERARP